MTQETSDILDNLLNMPRNKFVKEIKSSYLNNISKNLNNMIEKITYKKDFLEEIEELETLLESKDISLEKCYFEIYNDKTTQKCFEIEVENKYNYLEYKKEIDNLYSTIENLSITIVTVFNLKIMSALIMEKYKNIEFFPQIQEISEEIISYEKQILMVVQGLLLFLMDHIEKTSQNFYISGIIIDVLNAFYKKHILYIY